MIIIAALVLALIAVTSFISGVFGVAGGLILMGGLVYVLPVSQAMIMHGLAQFVSNATRVIVWRKYVALGVLAKFSAASILCLGVFAMINFVPSKTAVLFALGISTVILFFVPERWAPKITQPGMAYIAGVLGTALILMAGVSGTFLDQFFVRSGLDRRVTIATKAAMQCLSHLLKVAYFGVLVGATLDEDWWLLAAIVPIASIAGNAAATRVLERMTDKQFYWWTRRIVLVLGCYYMIEATRSWLG
jgi:uncharacterized protein